MQIGNTTVKLRNKNLAPSSDAPTTAKPNVHQRASDRISALSNQLISQWEQNALKASPKALKRQVDVSVTCCDVIKFLIALVSLS